jgi:hypothetical protein
MTFHDVAPRTQSSLGDLCFSNEADFPCEVMT